MKANNAKKSTIVLVDDSPVDLRLVEKILEKNGYRVIATSENKACIDIIGKARPDLVLLDIVMPDPDGYTICGHLKKNSELKDIPVIFISSHKDEQYIVKGFEFGAVDYITKPINLPELLARVNTHINLKKSSDLISEYLEKLNIEYLKREKLDFLKDKFLAMISHDLKNPLLDIEMNVNEMLDGDLADAQHIRDRAGKIRSIIQYLKALLADLVDIASTESGNLELNVTEVNYRTFVLEIISLKESFARSKNVVITTTFPDDIPPVYMDEMKMAQALNNIINNGLKYSPENSTIDIGIAMEGRSLVTRVIDHGPGISEENQKYVFDKYRKVRSKDREAQEGSGLGLAIVRNIIEAHRGTVGVISTPGSGATFYYTLPLYFDL